MNKLAAYTYPTNYSDIANYTPGVPRLRSGLLVVKDSDNPVKAREPEATVPFSLREENTNVGQHPILPVYEPLHTWNTPSGTGYGRPYWVSEINQTFDY